MNFSNSGKDSLKDSNNKRKNHEIIYKTLKNYDKSIIILNWMRLKLWSSLFKWELTNEIKIKYEFSISKCKCFNLFLYYILFIYNIEEYIKDKSTKISFYYNYLC